MPWPAITESLKSTGHVTPPHRDYAAMLMPELSITFPG